MKIDVCMSFTPAQKAIMAEVLQGIYHEDLRMIEVINNGRMRSTAGTATLNRIAEVGTINMNKRLFLTTGTNDDFRNTFTHELAHILANVKHKANCGHDYRWKREHKALGGSGKRCHDMEVNHLKAKRKKFKYKCDCNTYEVGIRRHNKMRSGIHYRCKLCKGRLEHVTI